MSPLVRDLDLAHAALNSTSVAAAQIIVEQDAGQDSVTAELQEAARPPHLRLPLHRLRVLHPLPLRRQGPLHQRRSQHRRLRLLVLLAHRHQRLRSPLARMANVVTGLDAWDRRLANVVLNMGGVVVRQITAGDCLDASLSGVTVTLHKSRFGEWKSGEEGWSGISIRFMSSSIWGFHVF